MMSQESAAFGSVMDWMTIDQKSVMDMAWVGGFCALCRPDSEPVA